MRAIQAMDEQELKWSRPAMQRTAAAIMREFHGSSPNHYPVEQYLANLHCQPQPADTHDEEYQNQNKTYFISFDMRGHSIR